MHCVYLLKPGPHYNIGPILEMVRLIPRTTKVIDFIDHNYFLSQVTKNWCSQTVIDKIMLLQSYIFSRIPITYVHAIKFLWHFNKLYHDFKNWPPGLFFYIFRSETGLKKKSLDRTGIFLTLGFLSAQLSFQVRAGPDRT